MRPRTLITAGITGATTLALTLAGGGVADAQELAPSQVFFGQAQGRALLGGCGVDFRAWVDYNPDRPGSITLNLQGLNTYGPSGDAPGGCDGWVAIRWANPAGLRIDWFTEWRPVHAGPEGGATTVLDLPTGSGRVLMDIGGTAHSAAYESRYVAAFDVP
ncbi:hypothetical protein OHB26_12845 [Nocardia sp. NBC_01503]|uniref:hypothetical protein n=1 Tax=Nocardia sp. NBC_01503 TaxID=2975997 RepID=UPI002E7BE284|nr:hypothetical protein [Nocardia sp. NBC_01503]WTL34995.1 hypothetical protein OHB26_12845 [Nocardia sp. NBC_01503]